jgi:hypothetical protein
MNARTFAELALNRARAWAAVVFVSAIILRFATLRYAAWLVGNRSVI